VRAVLARIAGAAKVELASRFVLTESAPASDAKSGLGVVLSPAYRLGTFMLWLAYFMGLVIFYALINWMPVLFKDAGIDPKTATLISALFPLGGVGAVYFGWLMDRFNANRIIAVGYGLTAVAIWAIGQMVGQVGALVLIVFLAGAIMNTSQSSLPALAAAFYPTRGRATGVAWMLGIGRFGGIAGSFLVATLASRQMGFADIFTVVAIPSVIAAVALLVKQWAHPEDPAGKAPTHAAAH